MLLNLLPQDERIVVVDGDLSRSSGTSAVRDRWPERFLNAGIAEQNAMGLAAGMALMGMRPIVHTFAAFASMRACEQIRTSIAYQNLNVTICVTKGGLSAARSGPTHHAIEDLAIMRAIPGMTVVAPRDFGELEALLRGLIRAPGPAYVRIPPESEAGGAGDAAVTPGRGVPLRQGTDVLIIVTGTMSDVALSAAETLAARGIQAGVLHLHTLKPLDRLLIEERAARARLVVTVEEHSIIGGLGSAVAELLAENSAAPLLRVGIDDQFCYGAGTHREMLDHYCVSSAELVRRIEGRLSVGCA
ncbi:transketolase family protein [Actinoplanes subtropicus]|uniref:transketolase family protein n=1 Tax=Actinoplanes subtropicus TaxID=543632 RepID=UPI00147067D4|nr:transketolase C-terminal domain-containing protein [Actinoplanes subtropicus]